MVFELVEGNLMGPPEILYNLYFRFALWPRDTSIGVVPRKLEFGVGREEISKEALQCLLEMPPPKGSSSALFTHPTPHPRAGAHFVE